MRARVNRLQIAESSCLSKVCQKYPLNSTFHDLMFWFKVCLILNMLFLYPSVTWWTLFYFFTEFSSLHKTLKTKMKRVGSIKQALRPSLKSNNNSRQNDSVNNNENKMNNSSSNNSLNHSGGPDVTYKSTSAVVYNTNTAGSPIVSILGNNSTGLNSNGLSKPDFHLPKSITSFLKKGTGTLTRNKKSKANEVRNENY